ncbi:MAG: hypothetical protein FJ308_04380, partial [Planctomycetes bacterium]|nr:hypothetical protein [Planctomycetota bacterium]
MMDTTARKPHLAWSRTAATPPGRDHSSKISYIVTRRLCILMFAVMAESPSGLLHGQDKQQGRDSQVKGSAQGSAVSRQPRDIRTDSERSEANPWGRFRGERGLGVNEKCRVAVPWKPEQVTKIPLPGSGNGSPVIWGNQAFLLAANEENADRVVVAVNLETNEIDWEKRYPSTKHRLHQF